MAEAYQMEADKVKELLGEQGAKQVKEDICVRKAADYHRRQRLRKQRLQPRRPPRRKRQQKRSPKKHNICFKIR